MKRPLRAALCPARRETPQSAAHRNGCNGRNGTACSSALEPAHMTARRSPPQEAGWLLGWAARGAGPGRAGRAVPRCTERCGGRRLSVPLALPAQVRRAGSAAVPRGGGGGTCHAREPYGSCGVPGGFGGGRAATAPRRERGGNEAGAAAGEGAAEAGEGLPGAGGAAPARPRRRPAPFPRSAPPACRRSRCGAANCRYRYFLCSFAGRAGCQYRAEAFRGTSDMTFICSRGGLCSGCLPCFENSVGKVKICACFSF